MKRYRISVNYLLSCFVIFFGVGNLTAENVLFYQLIACVLWLLVSIFHNRIWFTEDNGFWFLVLVLFMVLFISLFSPDTILDSLKVLGLEFIYFTPYLLFLVFKNLDGKRIVKFSWFVVLFFQILAILFEIRHAGFARDIAGYGSSFFGVTFIGGGYPLAYLSSFSFLYCVFEKHRIECIMGKIFWIAEVALSFVILIITQSTIILFCSVFGLLLYLVRPHRSFLSILLFSSVLLLSIVLIINNGIVLEWILNLTEKRDSVVAIRLNSILRRLLYGGSFTGIDSWGLRMNVYKASIEQMKNNWFWGCGIKTGIQFSSLANGGVGNHSQWLDMFATYGIIGFSLWIVFLGRLFDSLKHVNGRFFLCFTFVLLGFLNPIFSFSIFFVLLFLIPLTSLVPVKNTSFREE